MLTALILILVLLVAVVALVLRPRPQPGPLPEPVATPPAPPQAAPHPAPVASALTALAPAPAPVPASAATSPAALPEALHTFWPVAHEQLPADQVAALMQRLAQIPPPPLALHKLVSAEFLEAARPTVLADMIMAEAQIAARLLATVNAPKYGLRKPVGSVVQAVSLLGLNTVRALCLQHLLHNSFAGAGPAHRQRLDQLLQASTLCSTLCGRLAADLGLPEPGALVTQSVLSQLGQLASTVLLQPGTPAWGPHASLLARMQAEQQVLGLAAGELGALLMQAWGLPASIVAEVRGIDHLLFTPAHLVDARQAPRLALCYLSARLGERLAQGQLADLADLPGLPGQPLSSDGTDPDFCHLASYLALPALARLGEHLQSATTQDALRQLQGRTALPA